MKDKLSALSERIGNIKDKVKNEESTKQSMILPLLSILGYDIFNPEEICPEVPCDIVGKGDRIDYIIYKDEKPAILVECKDWRQNLDNHVSQLRKYFVSSDARFAILTNGIRYIFFSDIDKANIMDEKPFYSLDVTSLSDEDITFLSGFRKDSFNAMQMLSQSQDMKLRDAILHNLKKELANPSKAFVSLLTANIYKGKMYDSVFNKYYNIAKDCIELVLGIEKSEDNDMIVVDEEAEENSYKYTEDEQKVIDIVMGWLRIYETEQFHIYVRKLSDGYIRFCYNSEWWNICRIKVAWNNSLYVKICKEALAAKSIREDVKCIGEIHLIKSKIEAQCEDTKSRFFEYRLTHNL